MEVCKIFAGQIMRKQVPPEKTKDVLDFATKKPIDRLNSIKAGLGVTHPAFIVNASALSRF